MTERRGRSSKLLLDVLKERKRFMKFKEEAVDRCGWRTALGETLYLLKDSLQSTVYPALELMFKKSIYSILF